VVPPAAASVAVYAAPTTPWGIVVVEMLREVGVGVLLAGDTTTGTDCDDTIVCVFCTCN
jgi:hypothetical protein